MRREGVGTTAPVVLGDVLKALAGLRRDDDPAFETARPRRSGIDLVMNLLGELENRWVRHSLRRKGFISQPSKVDGGRHAVGKAELRVIVRARTQLLLPRLAHDRDHPG